jgi:hypothetical protein
MPSEPALKVVLRPPGREPYVVTLDRLTAHIRAARVLRMGRLADKLARASNAIASVETAVERDVDKIIARTDEVHAKRERVFLTKHMALDAAVTDLAEFEKDLEDFGKNDRGGSGDGVNAYVGTAPPKL